MRLIAFVGFKNAGKNSAAIPLQQRGFLSLSFADAIKDTLAAIFCWPRNLLEGDTDESRFWREQVDVWWADRLGISDFSPRRAMQLVGTEALRHHFHPDVWTLNVERRLAQLPQDSQVVIIDGRFYNEIALVRRLGGTVWRIKRGESPPWFDQAVCANEGDIGCRALLREWGIHESEYGWVGGKLDGVFHNDGSLDDLHAQVSRAFLASPMARVA